MTPTFTAMLAALEEAMDAAWERRDDAEEAHRLADEALLEFLRAVTMAVPPEQQRRRLAAVLDKYDSLR